ncbi:MAG: GUN4 domain-containing protein [Okeania sp. SIO3C4]|nr:GUN4 domain-containing protein [Okeania sp. SIO3C4]
MKNYENLHDLLAAGKWKEADQETVNSMLKVAKREKEGWFRVEDIDNFPCEDLRTIDQLWVKYSNGKFGFSVQKQIFISLGGTKKYNKKVWEAFGDKVGWRQEGKWLWYDDLTFSLDAHYTGHLPGRSIFGRERPRSFSIPEFLSLITNFSPVAQRLVDCSI